MTTPENSANLDPLDDLLSVLDLEPASPANSAIGASGHGDSTDVDLGQGPAYADVFIGRSQPMPHGRVFGGQVLAQSVIAAGRTVEDLADHSDRPRRIHSLHGYFLRAGDSNRPIRFVVERLRDGHSFSARQVHAIQNGQPILSMIASFQTAADGLDHQDAMPAAADPATLPTVAEEFAEIKDRAASFWTKARAIDLRHVEGAIYIHPGRQHAARQSVWLKATGQMPDDPLLHAAVLAYTSDYSVLEPVLRRHGLAWSDARLRAASLDHAMWFHRPGRADDWTLYTQSSPSASNGRGLAAGRMFNSDGALIASVAQEGMLRLKDSIKNGP
ncbi:MAG: acyl-CoA thioesterase [Actinomycetota bacterium]|nr:acyl-CoA thioesterase [Actinomycetota bacterium]